MKIDISADIEGITGVTHWDETDLGKEDSTISRQQMTAEVAAACEGALRAGATEIWVKDDHTVEFETDSYFEILRFMLFAI